MSPDIEDWLQLSTRRVVGLFLDTLARSHKWGRLYIVSPWISDFAVPGLMTSKQIMRRARDDGATVYVVTRPPQEDWHRNAVVALQESGVANVKLLPELHTKLFYADTAQGEFAMLGSANMTERSLSNRELGILVRSSGTGARIVKNLFHEAASIYHTATAVKVARKTL